MIVLYFFFFIVSCNVLIYLGGKKKIFLSRILIYHKHINRHIEHKNKSNINLMPGITYVNIYSKKKKRKIDINSFTTNYRKTFQHMKILNLFIFFLLIFMNIYLFFYFESMQWLVMKIYIYQNHLYYIYPSR